MVISKNLSIGIKKSLMDDIDLNAEKYLMSRSKICSTLLEYCLIHGLLKDVVGPVSGRKKRKRSDKMDLNLSFNVSPGIKLELDMQANEVMYTRSRTVGVLLEYCFKDEVLDRIMKFYFERV